MARFNPRMSFATVEDDERRASRHLIWAVGVTLAAALIWAANFHLDEITKAQGKIIPSSREQVIQSLDAGILAEMYVHEGDSVEKDQILLRIDDNRSGSVYREAWEKWLALAAQAARLRAESYSSPLEFPTELKEYPQIVERETLAYQARKQAVDEHIAAMRKSLQALSREIALTAPLVNEGVVSEVELLRLKRQEAELMGQIVERRNRYLTEANNELIRVESELSQTKENALAREDAYKRTIVRSPMKGVVKNIQVNTIGGVIQAGQNILEIVPIDDEMLVEAYVKPADVAFLKVGQAAVVKLTAYDFNKYGGLDGVLENLSPDTLKDENKVKKPGSNQADLEEGYYRILVRILNAKVERAGRVIEPLPGMTATVDIKTGEKTVLEYLIRPLQSVNQALRER